MCHNFVFFFSFFLQDEAFEERVSGQGQLEYTGRLKKRLILVLDCLVPHDFSDKNNDLTNLQQYVIKEKKLQEKEAVVIFFDIVRIVESLHEVRAKGGCVSFFLSYFLLFFVSP